MLCLKIIQIDTFSTFRTFSESIKKRKVFFDYRYFILRFSKKQTNPILSKVLKINNFFFFQNYQF